MTYSILNRTTFEWTVTDSPEIVGEEWVIDPQFDDKERCEQLGPRCWVFYKDGGADRIRSMTDQELDSNPTFVDEAKVAKLVELSEAARRNIIDFGIISSALGMPRRYDTDIEDQLNMVGAVTNLSPTEGNPKGGSMYYSSRDISTDEKAYHLHTYQQLKQVLADGAVFKLQILQAFAILKTQVMAQTSVSSINSISWQMVQ